MKKFLWAVLLLISPLIAEEKVMSAILDGVIIKDVTKTQQALILLQEDLNGSASQKKLQKDFKVLIDAWKRVETFYIASSLNEDSIDLPRYIDIFHNLKENLHLQMQRVIDSKDPLDEVLYKHSFKTINALEYVLFSGKINERKIEISKKIVSTMQKNLEEIKAVYTNDVRRFLSEFKWSNDVIINMLIESSFKLRDWRVGDISGHSRKYKGNPDNTRAEYYLSQNSTTAILAILQTHKAVMNSTGYDFGDMLLENDFKNVVRDIRNKIDESIKNVALINNENFEAKEIAVLYKSLDDLHKAYYLSLVNAVGVSTKILDADGD